MADNMAVRWFKEPQKHDYPAAVSFLSLVMAPQAAEDVVCRMQEAGMSKFAAKDIFRASTLSQLGISNSHVERDRSRIIRNEKLSPLLLVRDERRGKLVIADGYHRLCAVYSFDEDASIPCKIV